MPAHSVLLSISTMGTARLKIYFNIGVQVMKVHVNVDVRFRIFSARH